MTRSSPTPFKRRMYHNPKDATHCPEHSPRPGQTSIERRVLFLSGTRDDLKYHALFPACRN
eukprot:scaffold1290_cov248-Ochromonas_danica.AAC.39